MNISRSNDPHAHPAFREEDYECMLCLRLLFEPTTLKCGHSFCRTCCKSLFQQNHAKCPTCRKVLPIVHYYASDFILPSFTLCKLLETAFPNEYQQRRAEVLQLPSSMASGNSSSSVSTSDESITMLPIFYLDPMLPRQEMQLNIFEHRYLLMISRCLEGSRHFGMVGFLTRGMIERLRRTRAINTGEDEEADAMSMMYGVEVEIVESAPQPSGTIHIRVRAKRRFVIQGETWRQDGYSMANVKWVDLPINSCASSALGQEDSNDETPGNSSTDSTNEMDSTDDASARVMELAHELESVVEEWKALVISEGWQRYHGQLAQTLNSIGPMPEARDLAGAVDRALWVAALINPLPGMGVAPEIRHAVLEKAAAADGNFVPLLLVVSHGLRQSIEYLTPNAVLRWVQYQIKKLFLMLTVQGTNHLGPPPPLPGTHQTVNALLRLLVVCIVLGFFWQRILAPKPSIVISTIKNASESEL